MIRLDEDALICDLAETYQIYDYKQLPVDKVAVFACGLDMNSRIKQKMNGLEVPFTDYLISNVFDMLNAINHALRGSEEQIIPLLDLIFETSDLTTNGFETVGEFEETYQTFFITERKDE